MYDSFTEIELIARHRIAERVRYSPPRPQAALTDPQHGRRGSLRTSWPRRDASSP